MLVVEIKMILSVLEKKVGKTMAQRLLNDESMMGNTVSVIDGKPSYPTIDLIRAFTNILDPKFPVGWD